MVNVIKVYCGNPNNYEIRRLAVSSDVVSKFESLCVRIIELFPSLCGNKFAVCWKDAEGDLITVSSDAELAQALANAVDGLIKIYIHLDEQKNTDENKQESTSGVTHPSVVCDECDRCIQGHRYKCLECKDYDLCSFCNAANKHPNHDMIKLVTPSFVSRKWIGDLFARRMWRTMFGFVPPNSGCHADNKPKDSASNPGSSKSSPFDKWQEAFSNVIKNDLGPAEKLLQDCVGSFLNHGSVEVKIDKCPFAPFGGPFNHEAKNNEAKETEKESPAASANQNETAEKPQEDSSKNVETTEDKQSEKPTSENKEASIPIIDLTESETSDNEAEQNASKEPDQVQNQMPVNNEGDLFASCAGGWTLLNKEESIKKEPQTETLVEIANPTPEDKSDSKNEIHSEDPKIVNALLKMRAMGFTNEGGWLERLLVTKKGNINDALDALYPNTQRFM